MTTPLATVGGTTLAYSDKAVTVSTAYTYDVSAVDSAGNELAKAKASVTTPVSPETTAPSTPWSLAANSPGSAQVRPGVDGEYGRQGRDRVPGVPERVDHGARDGERRDAPYSDKTAVPNTSYTYQVPAVDAAGN